MKLIIYWKYFAICSVLLIFTYACSLKQEKSAQELTSYINPYIGTGGHGHVFLGANVPFGLVQLGLPSMTEAGTGVRVIITAILFLSDLATCT